LWQLQVKFNHTAGARPHGQHHTDCDTHDRTAEVASTPSV